ncbi:unnamed protein product [Mesocestoides corti]|nr:unnamed protein product [Mesocestoides corti]
MQDDTPMTTMKLKPNIFYCIIPFVRQLREYVKLRQQDVPPAAALLRSASLTEHHVTATRLHQSASFPTASEALRDFQVGTLLPPSAFSVSRTQSKDRQHPSLPKKEKKKRARSTMSNVVTSPNALQPPNAFRTAKTPLPCAPPAQSALHLSVSNQLLNQPSPFGPFPQPKSQKSFLQVDPTLESDSIWGGKVTLDIEALINALAPPPLLTLSTPH